MKIPRVAILGVPIQSLSMEEVVLKCGEHLEKNHKDPRYICTINVDFIVKAHSWNFTAVGFPELLKIYREADICLADGMPLVWLSKILGSPIKERITGKDLLPRLVEMMGKKEKAIYLIGGEEKIAKSAAISLHDLAPGLRVVGIATPFIYIEGENLVNESTKDLLLTEQINAVNPDLLAINLGNPKQEIWFDRVKQHLHVPLSIGMGGTLSTVGGALSRPSKWIQNFGLEWFYRLLQEPKRLWKRYFIDFFKIIYFSVPLIFYHTISRILYKVFYSWRKDASIYGKVLLFQSATRSLAVIIMPSILDYKGVSLLLQQIEEAQAYDVLALDFSGVKHIQPEGFGLLIKLWLTRQNEKKEIYALKVSKDIKLLMILHKVWDLIKEQACDSPETLLARLTKYRTFSILYDTFEQNDDKVIIRFFGSLDNTQNYPAYLERMKPIIAKKNCVLDLSYCTYLDNTGIIFLLNMRKEALNGGKKMKILDSNKAAEHQLKKAKVFSLFN